jgi:hypothetical protein
VAGLAGRDFSPAPGTCFAAVREAQLDAMGDLVAAHLDTAAVSRLITGGPPPGLPVIPPAGAMTPQAGTMPVRAGANPSQAWANPPQAGQS